MFSYSAYGLGIHSTLPLPEFLPKEVACDVSVRLLSDAPTSEEAARLERSGKQPYLEITPEEATLFLQHVGIFRVHKGREVTVTPVPDAEERIIQLYIAEAIMVVLLHQRGLFVLHGSAVEVDGAAIVFVGKSGWGKSTIAAALHARGHSLIADDVTAIHLSENSATVFPGFPQLKLSLQVVAALGYSKASLLPLHPREEKRVYRNTAGFSGKPLPLKGIYIGADPFGKSQEIVPLLPPETVIELVRYSYGIRSLHQAGKSVWHFLQSASLAKNVPFYRLNRFHSLSSLPNLAQMVEKHHARNSRPETDAP